MTMTRRRRRLAVAFPAVAGLVAGAATLGSGGTSSASELAPSAKTVATVSSSASDCDRGPWGLRVQGAPRSFSGGDRGGDYLWHDPTGFHLRVTHRTNELVVYSGVVTSPEPMTMDPVRLEQGDTVRLSADRRELVFAFANHGHVDGVNFHTACAARLTVSRLRAGAAQLRPDRVYLGAYGIHPHQVPFTLHRR